MLFYFIGSLDAIISPWIVVIGIVLLIINKLWKYITSYLLNLLKTTAQVLHYVSVTCRTPMKTNGKNLI